MTRLLGDSMASPPVSPSLSVDSDLVVILAGLLCALLCILGGLAAVTRCTWLHLFGTVPPPPPTNKGLKKKTLRSLPKHTFTPEVSVSARLLDCAICLAEFAGGEEIRVLPGCGHGFHVACIDKWLGSHSSCPSCRQSLAVVERCHKCGSLPGSGEKTKAKSTETDPRNTLGDSVIT